MNDVVGSWNVDWGSKLPLNIEMSFSSAVCKYSWALVK